MDLGALGVAPTKYVDAGHVCLGVTTYVVAWEVVNIIKAPVVCIPSHQNVLHPHVFLLPVLSHVAAHVFSPHVVHQGRPCQVFDCSDKLRRNRQDSSRHLSELEPIRYIILQSLLISLFAF